ncbi:MAG TPA: nucleoside deaminase [Polyangiaceae bacterium]|nr:nucleoside deaminase [Polyangiaceae bacterium]
MADEDLAWMRVALDEARVAIEHGDVPVGAVVVGPDGKELARAHNRREIDADPTAHAELVAVRAAASRRGHWRLDGCTLFVTLEPCAMCAGALVNARLSRLVFGATDPKAGAVTSLYELGRDARLNHRFTSEGGVLATESVELLRGFFAVLRARGEK